MITLVMDRAHQMQLDLETDRIRHQRTDLQLARDLDLRALRDYAKPYLEQYIVWQPGEGTGNEVHLTTATSCTCQRFKLKERCPHVAFVQRLADLDQLPDVKTPVAAKEI